MSVINQMLKDLDDRRSRPVAPGFVEALGVRADSFSKSGSIRIALWMLFFVSALLLLVALLNPADVRLIPRTEPLVNEAPVVVETKPVVDINTITGIEVISTLNNLELIFSLDRTPVKTFQTLHQSDNLYEFKMPDMRLRGGLVLPVIDKTLLESYSIRQADGDLYLRFGAKTGVNIQARVAEEGGVYRWVIHAEGPPPETLARTPVAKTKVVAKPALARESIEASPVTETADIRRPATITPSAETYYQRALEYLNASRVEPAITQLRETLRLQPAFHATRELLASLYLRTGKDVEAHLLLKEGVTRYPQQTLFAFIYARSLVERGQLPAARQVLEGSLIHAGGDPEYQSLLAAVAQRSGDHHAAVTYYMRALELNEASSQSWVGLGISLEALGRTAEAIRAYKAARSGPSLSIGLLDYIDSRLTQLDSPK
jgi:Tfp pilus assembly protein PilF